MLTSFEYIDVLIIKIVPSNKKKSNISMYLALI